MRWSYDIFWNVSQYLDKNRKKNICQHEARDYFILNWFSNGRSLNNVKHKYMKKNKEESTEYT